MPTHTRVARRALRGRLVVMRRDGTSSRYGTCADQHQLGRYSAGSGSSPTSPAGITLARAEPSFRRCRAREHDGQRGTLDKHGFAQAPSRRQQGTRSPGRSNLGSGTNGMTARGASRARLRNPNVQHQATFKVVDKTAEPSSGGWLKFRRATPSAKLTDRGTLESTSRSVPAEPGRQQRPIFVPDYLRRV